MRKLEGCDKVMYSSDAIIALGAQSVEEFTIPPFMTFHQEGREYLTRAPVDNEIFELREQCSELTVEISRVRSEFYESMNKLHEEKQKTSKLEQKYNSVSQKLQEEEEKTLNFNTKLIAARRTINDMKKRETEQSAEIQQLQKNIAELENQVKRAPKPTILHGPGSPHTIKRSRAEAPEDKKDPTYKLPRSHPANSPHSTDRKLRTQDLPITYWVACY